MRVILGPWRWMLVIYSYEEPDDVVLIVAFQDAALEEQRSEKYRHALIAVVSIGLRARQPGGADAWLSFHLVAHARICRP
jgi:hypothetical protein